MKKVFEITYETDDPSKMRHINLTNVDSLVAEDWNYASDPKITVKLISEEL